MHSWDIIEFLKKQELSKEHGCLEFGTCRECIPKRVILWPFPSVSMATTAHHYSPSKANSQSPLFQTRNKIQTGNLSHCFYFPSSITAPFRCYQASSTSVLTCRSQMVPVLPFLLVKLLTSHISFNKKVVLRTFPPLSPFTHSYKSDHLTYSCVTSGLHRDLWHIPKDFLSCLKQIVFPCNWMLYAKETSQLHSQ